MTRMLPFLAICALSACAQFPELDGTVPAQTANAPYPELVELEGLLGGVKASATDPIATSDAISARVSNLRARANRLRRTVVGAQDRARMQTGVIPQG